MRPKPDANRKRRIECDRAHLDSTTVSGLAVRGNVGLGSPTNSQPGRLRYVAQASGLRVLAASSRQFWWYLQDAPAWRMGASLFEPLPSERTSTPSSRAVPNPKTTNRKN